MGYMTAALNGYFPLSSSVYIVLRPPQPIWIPPGAELTDVASRKSVSTREKLRRACFYSENHAAT